MRERVGKVSLHHMRCVDAGWPREEGLSQAGFVSVLWIRVSISGVALLKGGVFYMCMFFFSRVLWVGGSTRFG